MIFYINQQVDVEVQDRDSFQYDAYIIQLHVSRVRIVRLKDRKRIKHAVDKDLERQLSAPFFYMQDVKGNITDVFFPNEEKPELVGLKKGRC